MRFEGVDDRRMLRRSEASRAQSRIHVLRVVRGVLINIKPLAILLLQRTLIRRRDARYAPRSSKRPLPRRRWRP